MKKFLILFLILSIQVERTVAQAPLLSQVTISVVDSDNGEPLIGALVRMERGELLLTGATNPHGVITFPKVAPGSYQLQVTYIGYDKKVEHLKVTSSKQSISIKLKNSNRELQEVVVTAKSSKGMTSSSLIGKAAMAHIQPSSIADVLELLPGGFSSDPQLTSPDIIRLREATLPIVGQHNLLPRINQSNYNTSSMGTTFLIDGVPLKMDAGFRGMQGNNYEYPIRIPINAGVDMRTISTDEVESIEVVRGIPSVEHSDLTSGLIKVKRKEWSDNLNGRFKSDMSSKLFFLSKGVTLREEHLNLIASVGYLSAYSDPRSVRDCYERINSSIRLSGKWQLEAGSLNSHTNIDYTGTLNDRKRDQDLDYNPKDSYKASYHSLTFSQTLSLLPKENGWLHDLEMILSATHTWDRTEITKDMLLNRDVPYLTQKEEGEFEGKYYPRNYVASHLVDSRPIYLYAKMKGSTHLDRDWGKQRIKYGATWAYSKNRGKGTLFDLDRPLFWTAGSRPRPFCDIPAKSMLSLFVEDELSVPLGAHTFSLMAGLVSNRLLHLDSSYQMSRKWYTDVRLNARWSFAPITVREQPLRIQLLGGIGSLSMFPSMDQLYPETVYDDFVELNYYHANPDYRLVYLRTYIYHPNNRPLTPAKNIKMEGRLDLEWAGYSASVTYFRERMSSGFRNDAELKIASFKRYNPSSVPYDALTAKPAITDFSYQESKQFRLLGKVTNGSETSKVGLEWMLSTPRYPFLNTRITFSGAWFRTTYRNSLPQYERPKAVLGDSEVPYIGIYRDNEILVREMLNSDLRLDSYLPKIGLGVSLSFQSNWYSSSQKMPISNYPDLYVDLKDGKEHPFREQDKSDTYLQWLKRSYSDSSFERYVVPFMMITNLKATKRLFGERLNVALFVNKIFDYSPDIHQKGYVIRRNQYPYFGMELMVTL